MQVCPESEARGSHAVEPSSADRRPADDGPTGLLGGRGRQPKQGSTAQHHQTASTRGLSAGAVLPLPRRGGSGASLECVDLRGLRPVPELGAMERCAGPDEGREGTQSQWNFRQGALQGWNLVGGRHRWRSHIAGAARSWVQSRCWPRRLEVQLWRSIAAYDSSLH